MRVVDFNADLGESYGLWERGADVELITIERARRILAEPRSALQPYNQDAWQHALPSLTTLEGALGAFEALRRVGADAFRAATDAQWAQACFHPERGDVTLEHLFEIHAAHGDHHIGQIAEFRAEQGW